MLQGKLNFKFPLKLIVHDDTKKRVIKKRYSEKKVNKCKNVLNLILGMDFIDSYKAIVNFNTKSCMT
jgi:hypothetical protein